MTTGWDYLWLFLAIIVTLGFAGFMLMKFVGVFARWVDLNKTLKHQNDEINRQWDESETPGNYKIEAGYGADADDPKEPETMKEWRKKWNWGIGEK